MGPFERRRVAKVVYDERDHSYWPSGGPWHRLREMVRNKLAAISIEMEVLEASVISASGPVVNETV